MGGKVTKRVSFKSGKPYDIDITRPSVWGNPFSYKENSLAMFKVKNRKESLDRFKEYLLDNVAFQHHVEKLRGKTIACWCDETQRCHGDIMIEYLNTRKLF